MKHVLAILLLASCSAFADHSASNGSEYQWQTPADKWEVTPEIEMTNMSLKNKNGNKTEVTGTRINVRGEYGISEMFSAGLVLGMKNWSSKTTTAAGASSTAKEDGMEDLNAFFHGRMATGPGSFRYGLDLGFGLAKREKDTSGDYNASTGGMSLTPFVGYEMTGADNVYGARLSYGMFMGERTETDKATNNETKITGPTTTALGLFYEHNMAPVRLGGALEFIGYGETKNKTAGVSTEQNDAQTAMNIKLYVPYEINEMITLLPEFNYTTYTAIDKFNLDSKGGWNLAVGGRFQF